MDRLDTILPGVLRKRGLSAHAHASSIVHLANAWIQRKLPRFCSDIRAQSLQHGTTLMLECTTSIAAQEVMPLLPDLQQYLQKEGYSHTLHDIRVLRERNNGQ